MDCGPAAKGLAGPSLLEALVPAWVDERGQPAGRYGSAGCPVLGRFSNVRPQRRRQQVWDGSGMGRKSSLLLARPAARGGGGGGARTAGGRGTKRRWGKTGGPGEQTTPLARAPRALGQTMWKGRSQMVTGAPSAGGGAVQREGESSGMSLKALFRMAS